MQLSQFRRPGPGLLAVAFLVSGITHLVRPSVRCCRGEMVSHRVPNVMFCLLGRTRLRPGRHNGRVVVGWVRTDNLLLLAAGLARMTDYPFSGGDWVSG
jgi:hypothetical protein